jgi:hypothetical protein
LHNGITLGFGEEFMRREPAFDKIRYTAKKDKDPFNSYNGYTKFYRDQDSYDGVPIRMTYETFPEGFWYSLAHLLWLMNKEFLYFTSPCYTVVVYRAMIGKGPRKFKRACREEQTAYRFFEDGIGYGWDGRVCYFDPWRSHLSSIPVVMLNCRLPIIQLLFGDMQFRALLLLFIAQACLPLTLTGVWWKYLKLKKPWFDNESNANRNYPWTCTWFIN